MRTACWRSLPRTWLCNMLSCTCAGNVCIVKLGAQLLNRMLQNVLLPSHDRRQQARAPQGPGLGVRRQRQQAAIAAVQWVCLSPLWLHRSWPSMKAWTGQARMAACLMH